MVSYKWMQNSPLSSPAWWTAVQRGCHTAQACGGSMKVAAGYAPFESSMVDSRPGAAILHRRVVAA
eukprot:1162019-Pelagomonas_calceolata.AAC.3